MEPQTADFGPRTKSKRWIWFFVALAVLGLLAIGINLGYNLGEPLTPEKLQAARELWQQRRPADYDLKILTIQAGATMRNRYALKIRAGKIVEFLVNDRTPEPLLNREGQEDFAAERYQVEEYDIDGLFDAIEKLMTDDRKANRSNFTRARFDKTDGHLQYYQRQVGGRQAQQIQVELKRVPPGGGS
jgi:hypothetical protein